MQTGYCQQRWLKILFIERRKRKALSWWRVLWVFVGLFIIIINPWYVFSYQRLRSFESWQARGDSVGINYCSGWVSLNHMLTLFWVLLHHKLDDINEIHLSIYHILMMGKEPIEAFTYKLCSLCQEYNMRKDIETSVRVGVTDPQSRDSVWGFSIYFALISLSWRLEILQSSSCMQDASSHPSKAAHSSCLLWRLPSVPGWLLRNCIGGASGHCPWYCPCLF